MTTLRLMVGVGVLACLLGCSSAEPERKPSLDGEVMPTSVSVVNHSTTSVSLRWEGLDPDGVSLQEQQAVVPAGDRVELSHGSTWGPMRVWDLVPVLVVEDDAGQNLYELPEPAAQGLAPDDGFWTSSFCGYPSNCTHDLVIEP